VVVVTVRWGSREAGSGGRIARRDAVARVAVLARLRRLDAAAARDALPDGARVTVLAVGRSGRCARPREAGDRTARVRVAVGLVGARDAGIGRAGGADGARDRLGRAVALAAVALVLVAVVPLLADLHHAVAAELELAGGGAPVVRGGVAVVTPFAAGDLPVATLEEAEAGATVAVCPVAIVALLPGIEMAVAARSGRHQLAARR